jgi:ubiquinone/menaquinone biosynthesis C-methylase UbiE
MHERRFHEGIERLRSPERIARLEIKRVVDLALGGIHPDTVLDIGTGSGVFAEAFAAQGLAITGLDANPDMLVAAQRYVSGGNFQPGIAEDIPFPDESFDLVFMGLLLHETDDRLKALQEAHRLARTRLVVLEWPYLNEDFGPGLEDRLQPSKVIDLARQAGFQEAETIRLEFLVLYRFGKN